VLIRLSPNISFDLAEAEFDESLKDKIIYDRNNEKFSPLFKRISLKLLFYFLNIRSIIS